MFHEQVTTIDGFDTDIFFLLLIILWLQRWCRWDVRKEKESKTN